MAAVPLTHQDQELQAKAVTHVDRANALVISDQTSYDVAAESLKGLSALKDEIEKHYKPLTQAAFEAHRRITAAEKSVLEPVVRAAKIVKQKLTDWTLEQERIRQEQERRARAEAERIRQEQERAYRAEQERIAAEQRAREEEQRLAAAVQAEAEGATQTEIEHLLSMPVVDTEPVYMPPPPPPPPAAVVASTYQRPAGISKPRDNWKAAPGVQLTENQALRHLIVAAAAEINAGGPAPLVSYLEVNQTALDGVARAQKELFSVPGYRAVNNPSISVRRN